MNNEFQLGNKVRHQHDDSWAEAGCVVARVGTRLRVFWPSDNIFSVESPCDLVLYESSCQPEEVAA